MAALVFASLWAMASKFMLDRQPQAHLQPGRRRASCFPALLLDHPATWWVGGNLPLLPVVLVGGLLMVRKLRRFDLVGDLHCGRHRDHARVTTLAAPAMALRETLLSSPLFFFAFVMLTEPLTAPTMRGPAA